MCVTESNFLSSPTNELLENTTSHIDRASPEDRFRLCESYQAWRWDPCNLCSSVFKLPWETQLKLSAMLCWDAKGSTRKRIVFTGKLHDITSRLIEVASPTHQGFLETSSMMNLFLDSCQWSLNFLLWTTLQFPNMTMSLFSLQGMPYHGIRSDGSSHISAFSLSPWPHTYVSLKKSGSTRQVSRKIKVKVVLLNEIKILTRESYWWYAYIKKTRSKFLLCIFPFVSWILL